MSNDVNLSNEEKRKANLKKLHARNYVKHGLNLNLLVSLISAVCIVAFITSLTIFPKASSIMMGNLLNFVTHNFDNFLMTIVNIFVVVLIIIGFSPIGKIRIGGQNAKKEFTFGSWLAMLFAAGMGIGLVFWGMAEPMSHYLETARMYTNSEQVTGAFATTFFNWGFHAWAIYGVIAIIMAFYTFNMSLPLAPRSFFYPLIKDKIYGTWGDIIDALSIVVTIAGLSTSLGLGAQQINAGLHYVFNVPTSTMVQILLILGITLIATWSVMSGLDKGVKVLSDFNLKLALGFVSFILIIGPTMEIIQYLFKATGTYIMTLPSESIKVLSITDIEWKAAWPIYYMAWWISFSPAVGIFIAKISHGRTIKEMVFGILVVPTIITVVWVAVFGGLGIEAIIQHPDLATQILADPAVTFFQVLDLQGYSQIISKIIACVFILLTVIFFVTSSDSGSLIVDSLASGGEINSPKNQRIFWALTEGFLAAAILYVGGTSALSTLQTMVIATGLVYGVILIVALALFLYYIIRHYRNQDIIDGDLEQDLDPSL